MNAFQSCTNTTDLVPLYIPQQLYLKPIARLNISLQLPSVKKMGQSISHWEVMGNIRHLVKPDEFTVLKVTKTTIDFIRFEAEVETRAKLERTIEKLNNKMIKLKDFNDLLRLRAAEWKSDFPTRKVWDEFFQNAKEMDEMKPGERPDTVHISNLPSKWFTPSHISGDEIVPSEKLFFRVFEKFGSIRYVDIPICDPYRKKMKDHISGFKHTTPDKTDFFEGYVQFKDYIGFSKTMDALRDMKLVYRDVKDPKEINIKVDFDRYKHLSDAAIRRREIVRDRLVKKAKEKEEKDKQELEEMKNRDTMERQKEVDLKTQKELRRKLREEKRKAKILEKLEIAGTDELNEKIAQEEKKLRKVQRKLEAIRLVEDLFKRIKDKSPKNVQLYDNNVANDELKKFKSNSEIEVFTQREKLQRAIKGSAMLKTILAKTDRTHSYSSSSSDTDLSLDEVVENVRPTTPVLEKYPELMYDPSWFRYNYPEFRGAVYPELMDPFNPLRGFLHTRGFPRLPIMPGGSRGFSRRRGNYPRTRFRGGRNNRHYLTREFSEHASGTYVERDEKGFYSSRHRNNRSRSRSRSYRSRSHSRKRRRSRSYSYRSSRSRSPRKSRRSRSRSYTPDKSRSHSRSKSRSVSKRKDKTTPRSRHKSPFKSGSEYDERTTKSRGKSASKDRSKSREKSVDSSTFISRTELHQQMSERQERSKESEIKEGSWST